jgi:hypothetical protein
MTSQSESATCTDGILGRRNVVHSDPGAPLRTGHAHSQYWDRYSTSLANIGHIVAGQPGQLTG